MIFKNTSVIHVYYYKGLEKLSMGRLALRDRKIFFEYTSEFLKTALELSPFKLPLKTGALACEDRVFDGLFGVFNDSLPDGWGRLLLDRKLMQLGINPDSLTSLDRLRYVGKSGMGALEYMPEIEGSLVHYPKDLDEIASEVETFQENDEDQFVDELLYMNGSSCGARPKLLLKIDEEDWMIKFRSTVDPKDIGLIEYAYHLIAQNAQLNVPESKLFPSKKSLGFFGVKRFDRCDGKRLHVHSLSGLIHADHRLPSLDYGTIMKVTAHITKDAREVEKQFRSAVFNVLMHNRDDHGKNFSFVMDEKGVWRVSPAYDLTFSSGPSGEHCTMVMGEGKNPNLSHLLRLAEIGEIKKQNAIQIIEQVKVAVSMWKSIAADVGVSKTSSKMIQTALDHISKNF